MMIVDRMRLIHIIRQRHKEAIFLFTVAIFLLVSLALSFEPNLALAEESFYATGKIVKEEVISRCPFLTRYTLEMSTGERLEFLAPLGKSNDYAISANGISPFNLNENVKVKLIKVGRNYYLSLDEKPKILVKNKVAKKVLMTDASLVTSAYFSQICLDYKWAKSALPVGFYYLSSGSPYNNTLVRGAIQKAANTWNKVTYSFFEFRYVGDISSKTAVSGDGINSICWKDYFYFDPYDLAVTQLVYDRKTLQIREFDIYVNKFYSFGFFGEIERHDFQSVILHEFGHAAGLCHVSDQNSVMYPYLSKGEIKRTLHSYDEILIGNKYPAGAVTGRILTQKGNPVYYPGFPAHVYVFDVGSNIVRLGEVKSDGSFMVGSVPEGLATVFFDTYNPSLFSSEPVVSLWYRNRYIGEQADKVSVEYRKNTNLSSITLPHEAVLRINGTNRFETAELAALRFFSGSKVIILANGISFADALCASSLGGVLKAPILLSKKDTIPREIVKYIQSSKPDKAYIIGGTGAVSKTVESQLVSLGVRNVVRIGGKDRYETSVRIAEKVIEISGRKPENLFICTGLNFPDALSVSALSYFSQTPILLVTKDSVPLSVRRFLSLYKEARKVIIGGSSVVGSSVYREVGASERWAGKNRYETCTIVAEKSLSWGMNVNSFTMAVGYDFPDAIVSGFVGGIEGIPVLLTERSKLPSSVYSYLMKRKGLVRNGYIAGGLGVVGYYLQNEVRNLIRSDR